MLRISDFESMFSDAGIMLYRASVPRGFANSGIVFDNVDNFVSFAKDRGIEFIFAEEIYPSIDDYIVTKKILEDVYGGYIPSFVYDKLDEIVVMYNDNLESLSVWDEPYAVLFACIMDGCNIICFCQDVLVADGEEITNPYTKSFEIITDNLENIAVLGEMFEKKKEEEQKKLAKYLLNEDKLCHCTNMSLRRRFAEELYANRMDEDYPVLKRYWTVNGAINFVEMLWRENKNALMRKHKGQ